MKKIILFPLLFHALFTFAMKEGVIQVDVCVNKTTTLIFDSKIVHVDLGVNTGIAFQVDESIPHVLKLKISDLFSQTDTTNLLVITGNNLAFSFDIIYRKNIHKYVYIIKDSFAINSHKATVPRNTSGILTENQIYDQILRSDQFLPRIPFFRKGKVLLSIENIYTDSKRLYFRCKLENNSSIKYNINFMSLSIITEKKNQAIADQDIVIPISFNTQVREVKAKDAGRFIISCEKITLETNKIAMFEIYENNGGRHLRIKITNDLILQALLLNSN